MPDLVVPAADSIMTTLLRTFRAGAPGRAASGVAPGSIFNCLTKWCALAVWSDAEDVEEGLEEDDDEDREDFDDDEDDDFDDEDFLDDDEDDDDLDDDDDDDDDELSDEDEVNIDDDRS